jgi:serine/threonine-protein kinase RsbT
MPSRRTEIQTERDTWVAIAAGAHLAREIGLSVVDCARVETAISELAHNILAHAGEGTITFTLVSQGGRRGLQICATDSGPGIANVCTALQDGFTTVKSLGIGLGVVKRMMDDFAIRSHPGWGTVTTAVKWDH